MSNADFPVEELIDSAESPENIDYGGPEIDDPPETLRCSICGAPYSDVNLPVGYANPVCKACDQLAVNEKGDEPWHGWPPGEEPATNEPDTEADSPEAIRLAPDRGENPVFIAGVKCWRRYRFGGWITRRDALDCDSLEEFRDRHRCDANVIYAFNTPQPDGVEIPKDRCRDAVARRDQIESLRDAAERIAKEEQRDMTVEELSRQVTDLGLTLRNWAPDPDEAELTEYAGAVVVAAEDALNRGPGFADLCKRYYEDFGESRYLESN